MFYALYFEIHHLVASAALGFARVAPIFFFLPFLNSGVLSGAPRNAIIILVALGVWPHALNEAPPFLSVAMIPLVSARSGGRRHAGLSAVMAFLGYACAGLYYR